MTTHANLMI